MADAVLVGLPGSGKTTTGRALAQLLGRDFVDTDDIFFERERVTVQDYLRTHDEADFRRRELDALTQAIASPGIVATGGGIVTTPDARRLLSEQLTVWLDCPDDVLVTRVATGDRPLLGTEPALRLSQLRQERAALYHEVSRFKVDASESLEQLVIRLLTIVENAQASS
jgi:shikimate kinase